MGGGDSYPQNPLTGWGLGEEVKYIYPFYILTLSPPPFSISVCRYICISVSFSLCLSISVSLSLCLSVSLSHSLCLSVCLSLSVCLFLCLCLFYLSFYLYLSLYSIINKKIILLFILQVCFYSLHIQIFYMNESSRPSF